MPPLFGVRIAENRRHWCWQSMPKRRTLWGSQRRGRGTGSSPCAQPRQPQSPWWRQEAGVHHDIRWGKEINAN
jgi:hypothetical protein